jgi:hypothetical protein
VGGSAAPADGPGAGPSAEEQRKRAKLWNEERKNAAADVPASPPAKRLNKRASLSALPAPRPAPAAKAPAASRRSSLASEMLPRRGAAVSRKAASRSPSPAASPSPPPKRAKVTTAAATAAAVASDAKEQKLKAKQWRDRELGGGEEAAAVPTNRRKSVGAELKPQAMFVEGDIPEALRPSRASSAATKQPAAPANRRSSMSSLKPVASTLGPAARVAAPQAAGPGPAKKKAPATPEPLLEEEEEEGEGEEGEEEESSGGDTDDTVPIVRPKGQWQAGRDSGGGSGRKPVASNRASFSAARRSSAGTSYDESIYAFKPDFRHQFVDKEGLSSPGSSAGNLSPLLNRAGSNTPSTVRSRRGGGAGTGRRGSKSSVKKNLIPADSESESESRGEGEGEGEGGWELVASGSRLSFSEQKRRARQWRDGGIGGESPRAASPSPSPSPSPTRGSSGSGREQAAALTADDPNAIEEAEAPETVAPAQLKTLQQKKQEAWLQEVVWFFGGVGGVGAFMALRVGAAAGSDLHLSFPLLPALAPLGGRVGAELSGTFFSAVDTFKNGLEFTVTSLRAVSLALLALAIVLPIGYGICIMIMWCWNNAKRKANLIEIMAEEAKDLLFEKYGGGPYPVAFLMEFLMDKYRREGSGRATELLAPGETLTRAAFLKLWPSVQREATADSRIEVLTRTYEGKTRECWRVIGGGATLHSTHLQGDFPVDDFGHEDQYSIASYKPAKVEGAGVAFV